MYKNKYNFNEPYRLLFGQGSYNGKRKTIVKSMSIFTIILSVSTEIADVVMIYTLLNFCDLLLERYLYTTAI